uniref:C2H2-type domain-containing protein n=1 Tax=Hucho hucho TaxID=62062 RepID=A0A4W5K1F3_9TELE
MSQLQLLREFLNERVMAAAVDIFGAVEKTVAEYQEENDRLRRLLRIDSLQLSLAVSEEDVLPEHQHCEQEWSFSLGQENTEATQIKEEEEQISQEEEQLQELFDNKNAIFTPACVTSKCDQVDPLTPPHIQTVENRECDPKQVNLTSFGTVTQLKALNIPCDPPNNQNNASSHSTAESSDPIGLDSNQTLDPSLPLAHNPPFKKHRSKPSNTAIKTLCCCDCGETFALKADLLMHVTLAKKQPSECQFCKNVYKSTCKLKAHVRLCHDGKTSTCPYFGKTFKLEGDLSKHMIHTGEKRFSCGDCGKSFNRKGNLTQHILTHTGEKLFSCGDCGKRFSLKRNLTEHVRTHTGEKPFSCSDCGKSFKQKGHLTMHKLTHTGEKPFSCGDCGKSFNRKQPLNMHKLTHTGEKPFSCDDCGKSFNLKDSLKKHTFTHTGEKPFSCGDCGKSFYQKGHLNVHKRTHTDSHRREII